MKLNNKGWGTLEMLLLSAGLIIALFVAGFFIAKLYGSMGIEPVNSYLDVETKLSDAAKRYVNDNNLISNGEKITITYGALRLSGYIDKLLDKNGNECNGYVLVDNTDLINTFTSFISCPNYTTNNY